MKTFNIFFNDNQNSNDMGFKETFDYCQMFIEKGKGDYFKSYKNGSVSIVCNETEEVVFEKRIN